MFADPKSTRFALSRTTRCPSPGLPLGLALFPTLGLASFLALGSFSLALASFFLALGSFLALGGFLPLSSFLALGSLAGPASTAEWAPEKQADGIDVYTRPVVGSDVKAFKAEGVDCGHAIRGPREPA